MQFRIVRRERLGFANGRDGIVPFFLSYEDIGALAQRFAGNTVRLLRQVDFRQRLIVFLLDRKSVV